MTYAAQEHINRLYHDDRITHMESARMSQMCYYIQKVNKFVPRLFSLFFSKIMNKFGGPDRFVVSKD